MRVTATWARWPRIAAVVLAAGLLATACSSGSATTTPTSSADDTPAAASPSPGTNGASPSPGTNGASPSPGTNEALCADAAALRASVASLTHITVGKGAANEIKSNLADVQAKLTALTAQAKGEMQAQTSALKSALTKLQTAVSNLAAHPSASTVSGVVHALGAVAAAASSLLAALSPQCTSASASPST